MGFVTADPFEQLCISATEDLSHGADRSYLQTKLKQPLDVVPEYLRGGEITRG